MVGESLHQSEFKVDPTEQSERKSKNAQRKAARLERVRQSRILKRKAKKEVAKKRKLESSDGDKKNDEEHVSKKAKKLQVREKLQLALLNENKDHLRVCLDLQFEQLMSEKELVHLSRQLCRIYGANKSLEKPTQVFLTSLPEESKTFKVCNEKNDGFSNYIWCRTEKNLLENFASEKSDLVFLTPDSPRSLTEVSKDKIYIIGGLVDDSVHKHTSLKFAEENGIATAKLPITEHCARAESGSFKQILTLNQVFDILTGVHSGQSWKEVFDEVLPKRIGFK